MRYYLTGFMGSGKSYLGMLWAADNGFAFYDLDHLIEAEERMTVNDIFFKNGEAYFREKEAAVLRNTEILDNCIIACGGGTACYFDNMDWMNKNGTSIFLDETADNIYHHVINDKKPRPLLLIHSGISLKEFIQNKLAERKPFYEKASIILPASQLHRNGFSIVQKLM